MSNFQPLGCGFGRSVIPQASPADTTSETPAMTKNSDSIGDTILRLIGEAGGTISSSDLRDKLPDLADANRSYYVRKLIADGRLTATGKTSGREYALAEPGPGTAPKAGHRIANAKKTAKAKPTASKQTTAEPFDQFEHAEREASARLGGGTELMPRPQPGINIAVAIVRPVLEDQHSVVIEPAFLRRVLRLALSVPGEISDADRQALHAIALAS